MLLLILFFGLTMLLILWSIEPMEQVPNGEGQEIKRMGAIVLIVVGIVVSIVISLGSSASVESKTAFYYENQYVYADAVERGLAGVPRHFGVGGSLIDLDMANQQQVNTYMNMVDGQREKIMRYNRGVRMHRRWQDSFFLGLLMADLPDSVKTIR